MAENKKSVWSTIILVVTIISLVLLVLTVILTVVAIPAVTTAAKQAAEQEGLKPAEVDLAVSVVIGSVVAALVISSAFQVLKIIGGFKFALQGKWGIFCIVVAILAVGFGIWSLISNIANKAGGATIATTSISLIVDVIFCIACFKHHAEIQ